MRRLRLGALAALAVVAVGVVAAGWLEPVPEISAADAVVAADRAFARAGLEAEVEDDPARGTYVSDNQEPVDTWTVRATVRSAAVLVHLARAGAQPVSIDDRAPNGTQYVLSELEYRSVARSVDDPSLTRTVRRNIALTLGAVLVVADALALALVTERRRQEPR